MPTRRDLLKQSAKVVWAAPVMTTGLFGFDIPRRAEVKMYSAYFVQKTSGGEVYSDFCNADCREWWSEHDPLQTLDDILQDIGGWWAYPTKDGF